MTAVVLGVDLGAGSLRVGAVTAHGTLLAAATTPLRIHEPAPGWSTADPATWWRGLKVTTERVLTALPRHVRVEGLCIAGMTRAQVLLDRGGRSMGRAWLFRDRRAVAEALDAAQSFPASNPADAITAFHPLARIAWIARHEPQRFGSLATLLEPKDYLAFRLTGEVAADAVTYSRFDALQPRGRLPDVMARALAMLALPRRSPWQMQGRIRGTAQPFRRIAGVPVFAGAMDTWAAAIGAGAAAPGVGYDIAGTSEAVGAVSARRAVVPGLVTLVWSENAYQIGGPTQAGADCATWGRETFRIAGRLADAVERAARQPAAAEHPLFVPYLAGERAPVWRADVRGALHGLARTQHPDVLLWAVLDGVAMAVRDILERAAEGAGEALGDVRIAGGGARSDGWCQIKADVIGVPLRRTAHRETGVVGAAIAASVGLGWHPTLAAACDSMVRVDRVFLPRAGRRAFHAERFARYRQACEHALVQTHRSSA